MMVLSTLQRKYREGGITGLSEAIWRNSLRRSPVGSLIEFIFGKTLVEKMVMAPRLGYWPHIQEPRSFNEKIMHRKLFTDKQIYTKITDKSSVRTYIRSKIDEDILNEVYDISDNPESIPFESLPNEFVIKTGNKGIVVVDNKEERNKEDIVNECKGSYDESFGKEKGEYWYSKTNPKYIVEKRLYGKKQSVPLDYKFFVFHGDVKCIQVDYGRFSRHTRRLYKPDWTPIDVEYYYPSGPTIEKPDNLEHMINISEKLGEDFDFIRVDLFETENNGVVFGELTLAPENGGGRFNPKEYDFELGKYW